MSLKGLESHAIVSFLPPRKLNSVSLRSISACLNSFSVIFLSVPLRLGSCNASFFLLIVSLIAFLSDTFKIDSSLASTPTASKALRGALPYICLVKSV